MLVDIIVWTFIFNNLRTKVLPIVTNYIILEWLYKTLQPFCCVFLNEDSLIDDDTLPIEPSSVATINSVRLPVQEWKRQRNWWTSNGSRLQNGTPAPPLSRTRPRYSRSKPNGNRGRLVRHTGTTSGARAPEAPETNTEVICDTSSAGRPVARAFYAVQYCTFVYR